MGIMHLNVRGVDGPRSNHAHSSCWNIKATNQADPSCWVSEATNQKQMFCRVSYSSTYWVCILVSACRTENRVFSHRALISFKQTLLHEYKSAEEAPLRLRDSPYSMNPSSLHSSYSRYKADTDTVTEWLLATSTKCGFQKPESTDERPGAGPKTSRLKGKARKIARASGAVPNNRSIPVVRHYRIKSHELVNMAQSIAKTKQPRVQVPRFFLRALTRAIDIRKSHQLFYDSYKDGQGRAMSDYGHAHFIHILENVLEILRLYAPEAGISPESRKSENHATVSLTKSL